jgi:hypothetical protein
VPVYDTYREWDVDLRRAEKALVPGEILKLQRRLVFLTLGAAVELAPGRFRRVRGIILMTPVDTGRARGSWNVSLGRPDPSYSLTGPRRRPPGVAEATAAMRGLGVYQEVWIASGLPYMPMLEYGGYPDPPEHGSWDKRARKWVVKSVGGRSRQAPQGMVRVTWQGVLAALGKG